MAQIVQNNINLQMAFAQELEEKKERHANVDFKMVAFSLGGKDYAIDILKVKEIAKADRFTYVPNTAPFVVGVYNLRGEIIPIIDLRLFFNVEEKEVGLDAEAANKPEFQNMIIIQIGDQKYGTIVDRIERVAGIQSSTIQPPHPLFADINIKYIYGIVEYDERMYILLDVARIFGVKDDEAEDTVQQEVQVESAPKAPVKEVAPLRAKMGDILSSIDISQNTQKAPPVQVKEVQQVVNVVPIERASTPIAEPVQTPQIEIKQAPPVVKEKVEPVQQASQSGEGFDDVEFKFVIETLKKFQSFHTNHVNDTWIRKRYNEWKKIKGEGAPLNDTADAIEFLKPFYSKYTGGFWTKEFADTLCKLLPDNSAKQIHVWNPGCAAGYESYSLACALKMRYPNSVIKVYAHDTDLILISGASVLQIPSELENTWYKPYISKTVSGELTFSPEIKESILFEYHDCTHMNIVPSTDLIFSRDFLSFVSDDKIDDVLLDFYEKLKDTGILMIGENELVTDNSKWLEKMCDNVVSYNKL